MPSNFTAYFGIISQGLSRYWEKHISNIAKESQLPFLERERQAVSLFRLTVHKKGGKLNRVKDIQRIWNESSKNRFKEGWNLL